MEVPVTDTEVYEMLDKGNQIVDNGIQRTQSLQSMALTSILQVIEAVNVGRGGLTEDHLECLLDSTRTLTMGFSNLNQVWKDMIRNY